MKATINCSCNPERRPKVRRCRQCSQDDTTTTTTTTTTCTTKLTNGRRHTAQMQEATGREMSIITVPEI